MDSLGDYIQVRLRVTHACPLNSVFVQIDHAGGLWQARPPLAHGNSFALVAVEDLLVALDALHRDIVVENHPVAGLLYFPPVVLLEGRLARTLITH